MDDKKIEEEKIIEKEQQVVTVEEDFYVDNTEHDDTVNISMSCVVKVD